MPNLCVDNLHYEKFADGTVKEVDVPFDIPESWEWVRFSEVSTIVRGGSPRPIKEFITEADDGINWIKIGDTDKGGKFINSTKEKIKPSGLKKTRYVTKGTFLLTNSMSFGRPYILNVDGAIHDGWLAISNYEEVFSRDFLYYLLSSKVAYHQFLALISGAVVKNLNSDKVASLLVPVPPQKEQERIVSAIMVGLPKVDDYQKLHDRLEKINKEFPEKLRKSILQYAMQGKLVPQDPNDEPVEVLLEKIRQEKQKLFEEGKLKKKDLQESIIYKGDDNSYYEKSGNSTSKINYELPNIPSTWCWSRLNASILSNIGLTFKPTDITSTGIPVLKANNIRNGRINYDEVAYVRQNTKIKETEWLSSGDVLMAVRSGSKSLVGKVAVIYDLAEPTTFGAFMSVIRPLIVVPEYLTIYFESPFFRNQLEEANTTTIYQVTQKMLKEAYYPIAPCQEQQRIIARVSQLNEKLSELVR